MNGTRLARNLSAAVVASIAAWSSYQHMVHVALSVGERPDVAYVLPLSVDGMLVVASVAMVDDKRAGRAVRWSAKVAFTTGVLASVAANVAAAHPTIGARIVAAWPALALLLTVELLTRAGKALKTAAAVAELVDEQPPAPVAVAPDVAAPDVEPAGERQTPLPERRTVVQRTPKRQPSAADRIAAAVARSPRASDATIASKLGLSEATVKRHRRQAVDSVSTEEIGRAHV